MANKGHFTLAYLDDYAGCARDITMATAGYDFFFKLAPRLGLALAEHKFVAPTKNITWLGYLINTEAMTVSVPPEKMSEILTLCQEWTNRRRANLKMVQSLAGKLLYVANCIIPARRFLTRILATLRALAHTKWITFSKDFRLNLKWFLNFASLANGSFYYIPERKEIEIQCDSSLVAGGGVASQYYYSWKYARDHINNYSKIHHLEAINLLVAYRTLAPLVGELGALIVISTDNLASSCALETGRTQDPLFARCSREMWLQASINNHSVVIRHKHGSLIPMPSVGVITTPPRNNTSPRLCSVKAS